MARYVRTQAIEHPIGSDGRVVLKVTAADGRGATRELCRDRLARQICADSEMFSPDDARAAPHQRRPGPAGVHDLERRDVLGDAGHLGALCLGQGRVGGDGVGGLAVRAPLAPVLQGLQLAV